MKESRQKRRAVAVKYEPRLDNAPKVIAKGKGNVASRIIEIARDYNLHIHEEPELVEMLSQLDLHEEIPPELYVVVAELLAFVYGLNRERHSQ